jgi:hypothetical protein
MDPPSSNLWTMALTAIIPASDYFTPYLSILRLSYLIKPERAEPTITRGRQHALMYLLAQLLPIHPSVLHDLGFYLLLQASCVRLCLN